MDNPFDVLNERLDKIEQLFTLMYESQAKSVEEKPLDINGASDFTGLPVSTIYNLVSKSAIPYSKPGKRLFFFKKDLIQWIASYNKKTISQIYDQADLIASGKGR